MKKIKIFTNNDLDGAGSLMLLKWVFDDSAIIDHTVSNVFKLKRDYNNFLSSNEYDDYSKVFILNMIPTFTVEDNTLVFSKSNDKTSSYKGKVEVSTSTTKLLRIFFKNNLSNLSLEQNALINSINSFYIDGKSKTEGIKLNAILNYGRNKYSDFYTRFDKGIGEYTDVEKTILKNYSDNLVKTYKQLELFEHNTNKGIYIGLIPDMLCKHEILDMLFKKHSPKMIFLVDLENGFISVRKDDSLQMDMSKLCKTFIEGRSLRNCAGGRYTEKFLDFSRSFM